MTTRPTFERSIDVTLVANLLTKVAIGETIGYPVIVETLGRTELAECYQHINAARHRLLRDEGMVFGTVRKVGLKRLNDVEVIATAEADRRHLRRYSRRALTKLSTIERDKLNQDQRHRLDAEATILAMVTATTKEGSVKKIEKAVTVTGEKLPLGKTLESLR